MSPVKESVIRLIESLPDDCTLDDIHYHLYVREKVEHGMAVIDAGKVVPQEEAERRFTECGNQSRHPSLVCHDLHEQRRL